MAKTKKKDELSCAFKEEDFINHNENYEKRNIADETKRYCIINGINRNVARHIPSGYDGLKPVVRRILLVLYEDSNKSFQKVNKIAGNVMGKYHPHGDSAIEEVIGKLGQAWNNNVLYIDPDGNFGNEQGDSPAAGRYIKCKLSKFAYKCFFEDYKYASLDKKGTYTGDGTEPEYLPAKYPVALVNPQFSSIGYGTAANIAPYNFTEVMEATMELLKNPDANIKLIPDFPNGCEVVADKNVDEINSNHGAGKVTVRSTIEIDHDENIIHIRSLPLKIGTKMVNSAIAQLIKGNKIEGIKDIFDNTSPTSGVWIKIVLNQDVNAEKIIADLLKKGVGLQKTFGVQIKFIEDYKEDDYSPKEYLLNWIDFRREIVQSMHNRKYVLLKQEDHMNEIKLFVCSKDNAAKTLKIIKKSKDNASAIEEMMNTYTEIHMSSLQAKTICNMRMSDFNQSSYQGFIDKKEELKKQIKESERIIANPALIDEIIKKELEEGIKLFGKPRKSKIIYAKEKAKKVTGKNMVIAISKDGLIKKIDPSKYATIGSLGNTSSQEVISIQLPNNNSFLVFDSSGRVSKVPVVGIPEMSNTENGVPIDRYFKVSGRVVSIMPEIEDVSDDAYILFISKNGYAKRTLVKEFLKVRDEKVAMTLNPKDALISTSTCITDKKGKDLIIYTNFGNGIRLNMEDIPAQSAATKGRMIMKLSDAEEVVGVDKVNPSKKLLFYITSAGRAKVTELKYLPAGDMKDAAISLIALTGNEKLVSIESVTVRDKVMVFRKVGEPEVISVAGIKPSMRIAKGEKVMKVPKGDLVLGTRLV